MDMVTHSEEGRTSEQLKTLHNLVVKNLDVSLLHPLSLSFVLFLFLSLPPSDVGHTGLIRYQINTGSALPVRQPAW